MGSFGPRRAQILQMAIARGIYGHVFDHTLYNRIYHSTNSAFKIGVPVYLLNYFILKYPTFNNSRTNVKIMSNTDNDEVTSALKWSYPNTYFPTININF